MNDPRVIAAGRPVPDAIDRIRRYCGLPWSGGQPETWAWQYYDVVPSVDDSIGPVDVLCAAALHPGLSRDDLAWFRNHADDVTTWLDAIPMGRPLGELDASHVNHIASLPAALAGPSLALVIKVVHRKRPDAIPLLDRHVSDWYRPVTGRRAATEAWGPLVETMADDDRRADDELGATLRSIDNELAPLSDGRSPRLTLVRARDIAIWMGSR